MYSKWKLLKRIVYFKVANKIYIKDYSKARMTWTYNDPHNFDYHYHINGRFKAYLSKMIRPLEDWMIYPYLDELTNYELY